MKEPERNGQDFQAWINAVQTDPRARFTPKGQPHIANAPIADTLIDIADKKVSAAKRTAQSWEKLGTGHKVNASISGACALMSAFSTFSAVSNSIARDADGKAHIQWSQVGVALLQGTIAAGCAYFAVESLHGRSVF